MQSGTPIERLKALVRADEGTVPVAAGRNDPCPCGSGLKYKKCCLGKVSGATTGPRLGGPG